MYARRAHCPNMQSQLQENLTAQTSNLLLFIFFPLSCQLDQSMLELVDQITNLKSKYQTLDHSAKPQQ